MRGGDWRTTLTAVESATRARLVHLVRRGRTPGLRTAKTTLAAVLSYVIAKQLGTSAQPVLAPLTAILVVQLTMYETVAHGLGRVGSVLAGVLVAIGVASFVGLTWWSLGIVVAVSLIVGRLLRLGPNLLEVPISAMLVLAVGGSEKVAAGRVYETVLGAAVGVAVNVVIAPPLYMQPAGDAVSELADRMAEFIRGLAGELRSGWSRDAADRWLDAARGLDNEVARADRTLGRAEESARLNPRGGKAREAQPPLRTALTGLELSQAGLRSLARALLDRTYFVPGDEEGTAYGEEVRVALADVLDAAASAVQHVIGVTSPTGSPDDARKEVDTALAELHRRRDRLAELLLVDPYADQAAWQQHGALLAAVDRLRIDIEAAVRPPSRSWRPTPVTDRQRQAVRRMFDARAARQEARQEARDEAREDTREDDGPDDRPPPPDP